MLPFDATEGVTLEVTVPLPATGLGLPERDGVKDGVPLPVTVPLIVPFCGAGDDVAVIVPLVAWPAEPVGLPLPLPLRVGEKLEGFVVVPVGVLVLVAVGVLVEVTVLVTVALTLL
jgi:hypothetical protein